jgi:phosphatidate cytidylyltransferase
MKWDAEMTYLGAGVLTVLLLSTAVALVLKKRSGPNNPVVTNLMQRTMSWWVIAAVLAVAIGTGHLGAVVLFGLVSFLALREFLTLTPTRRSDHRSMLVAFLVVLPLQYYLVEINWYGLYIIFIPVYSYVLLPSLSALAGDTERFLERTAEIQWGLMICVYAISYAPALMQLELPGFQEEGAKLLVYLVIVVEASDVFQYVWGKLFGRHKLVPAISPNKTWEGLIGGIGSAVLIGTGLWWATPFAVWESAILSLVITVIGFLGGLTMSAIKRDRRVKDFGTLVQGHGGIMDRIDSLCFAAPIFFHLVRFYWLVPRAFPFSIGP